MPFVDHKWTEIYRIWSTIFLYLPVRDVCSVRRVCTDWTSNCSEYQLWELLILRDFDEQLHPKSNFTALGAIADRLLQIVAHAAASAGNNTVTTTAPCSPMEFLLRSEMCCEPFTGMGESGGVFFCRGRAAYAAATLCVAAPYHLARCLLAAQDENIGVSSSSSSSGTTNRSGSQLLPDPLVDTEATQGILTLLEYADDDDAAKNGHRGPAWLWDLSQKIKGRGPSYFGGSDALSAVEAQNLVVNVLRLSTPSVCDPQRFSTHTGAKDRDDAEQRKRVWMREQLAMQSIPYLPSVVADALFLTLAACAPHAERQLRNTRVHRGLAYSSLLQMMAPEEDGGVVHPGGLTTPAQRRVGFTEKDLASVWSMVRAAIFTKPGRLRPFMILLLVHHRRPLTWLLSAVTGGGGGEQPWDSSIASSLVSGILTAGAATGPIGSSVAWVIITWWELFSFFVPDLFVRGLLWLMRLPIAAFCAVQMPGVNLSWSGNWLVVTCLLCSFLTQRVGLTLAAQRCGLPDKFFSSSKYTTVATIIHPVRVSSYLLIYGIPLLYSSAVAAWFMGNSGWLTAGGGPMPSPGDVSSNFSLVNATAESIVAAVAGLPPAPEWRFTEKPLHTFLYDSWSGEQQKEFGGEVCGSMLFLGAFVIIALVTHVTSFFLRVVSRGDGLSPTSTRITDWAYGIVCPLHLLDAAAATRATKTACQRCLLSELLRHGLAAYGSDAMTESTRKIIDAKKSRIRACPEGEELVAQRAALFQRVAEIQLLQLCVALAGLADLVCRGANLWQLLGYLVLNEMLCSLKS